MSRRSLARRSASLVATVALALAARGTPVRLDIPAQSTAHALIALSRQTSIELLFVYSDLKHARSPVLHGEFEPADALVRLLAGTGYAARVSSEGKFYIVADRAAPAPTVARATRPAGVAAAPAVVDSEPVKLADYVVTPSRFGISEDLAPRAATFTHDEIARLPQLGEDVFRAIARVPGLSGSDFSAKFWVRGAANDKILTRLDGNTLIEPFHLKDLGGALSVIDLETVSRLDLITGGFTSEYGDRLAGVMLLETDRPVASRPRTTLGLSLMGARGTSRGTFADGRGAWLASLRLGYPDVSLEIANAEELTPRYHDAFAKVEYDLDANHTLAVSVLSSRDRLRYLNPNDSTMLASHYRDDYAWLRWQARFGAGVSADTALGVAALAWNRSTRPTPGASGSNLLHNLDDQRRLDQLTLRQDWTVESGAGTLFRAGFEAARGSATYRYGSTVDSLRAVNGVAVVDRVTRDLARDADGRSFGIYAAWRQRLGEHVVAETGLRQDRQSWTGGGGLSPRVNLAAHYGATTLRAAWGVYRQAQGLHDLPVRDGETTFQTGERATHVVLGLDRVLRPGLVARAEVFQRRVADPLAHWENLVNPLRLAGELEYDRVRLAPTAGRAQGAEASLRGTGPRLRWSASYAWTRAEEALGGRWLPVARDQRHTVTLDGTWSPNARWDFSAAWQYRSGWPTTHFIYDTASLNNGGTLFTPRLLAPLGARLPGYHRLDLRVTRIWRGPSSTVRAFIDLFNVYGAGNVFRYDARIEGAGTTFRITRTPQKSLPLLPSAGVQWDF